MPGFDHRDEELVCLPDEAPAPMSLPPEAPEPLQIEPPVTDTGLAPMSADPALIDAQLSLYENYCEAPASTDAAPPALGLNSYDVVPDDFVGPLAPNQIRQSQRDDLDHFNFSDFNVVPDDFIGPLEPTQMRQSEYAQLQQAWLNISAGQGMSISGSGDDREAFRQMLRDGMTDSRVFRNTIAGIGNDTDPDHLIQADVGRSQPGVIGDSFASNEIDLDDLDQWPSRAPDAHPDQFTRNEAIVHFLSERQHALASANPADFGPAHTHGIEVQNQYRAERGQAAVTSQIGAVNPDGSITATVAIEGGSSETWQIDAHGNITGITPP
jgi:hypothetical protein